MNFVKFFFFFFLLISQCVSHCVRSSRDVEVLHAFTDKNYPSVHVLVPSEMKQDLTVLKGVCTVCL